MLSNMFNYNGENGVPAKHLSASMLEEESACTTSVFFQHEKIMVICICILTHNWQSGWCITSSGYV